MFNILFKKTKNLEMSLQIVFKNCINFFFYLFIFSFFQFYLLVHFKKMFFFCSVIHTFLFFFMKMNIWMSKRVISAVIFFSFFLKIFTYETLQIQALLYLF